MGAGVGAGLAVAPMGDAEFWNLAVGISGPIVGAGRWRLQECVTFCSERAHASETGQCGHCLVMKRCIWLISFISSARQDMVHARPCSYKAALPARSKGFVTPGSGFGPDLPLIHL